MGCRPNQRTAIGKPAGFLGALLLLCLAGPLVSGGAADAATQAVTVVSLAPDGQLSWTAPATCGWYTIEWASQATGVWSAAWREQTRIAATGGVQSTRVPLFFRVSYSPQCRQADEVAALGNGTSEILSGRLAHLAIVPSTTVFRLNNYTLADAAGNGYLTGTPGGGGYLSYETGQFTVVLPVQAEAGVPLLAGYDYVCNANTNCVRAETLFNGNGSFTAFTGQLASPPVQTGSVSIVAGSWFLEDDDGDGSLAGPGGAAGHVDYLTGAVEVTFPAALNDGVPGLACYKLDNCD